MINNFEDFRAMVNRASGDIYGGYPNQNQFNTVLMQVLFSQVIQPLEERIKQLEAKEK